MKHNPAPTPEQIAADERPEHEWVKRAGKTVCLRCWNVLPVSGVPRMKCRRKQESAFMGGEP